MGQNNWAINIQKNWHWQEKMHIQFRAEMYNALNHTQLFAPDQFFGDPTFGQVSTAWNGRSIQMALKLYW